MMKDSIQPSPELVQELQRSRARVAELEAMFRASEDAKQAAAALEKSEKLHRLTLENISDAVFVVDDSGRFTYICPNVHVIFVYSVDEVRAMDNISALLGSPLVVSEELNKLGEISNIECPIVDKDGKTHHLLVNVKRVAIDKGSRLYSCRDVTERKSAEDALRLQQDELREVAAKLVGAREDERKQMARELHDDFSQRLAVLNLDLTRVLQSASTFPEGVAELLKAMRQSADDLASDCHQLSRRLHPSILDDLGLKAALESECAAFSKQHDISTGFTYQNLPVLIPEDVQLCLYRVVQESLQNVAKHAEADEILVTLSGGEKGLALSVRDNGKGFDPVEVRGLGGLGLVSITERVRLVDGNVVVRSQRGEGTEVAVQVPLEGGS